MRALSGFSAESSREQQQQVRPLAVLPKVFELFLIIAKIAATVVDEDLFLAQLVLSKRKITLLSTSFCIPQLLTATVAVNPFR
jgi:hypothetical protein